MTVPQIREAMTAFPADQQALLRAMLRGADDNGFLRGVAKGSRVGPFEPDYPVREQPPKKGKRR
jgi:hypothetical protein